MFNVQSLSQAALHLELSTLNRPFYSVLSAFTGFAFADFSD